MAYNVTTLINGNMPCDMVSFDGILPCDIIWAKFMNIKLNFGQSNFK